MGPGGQREGEDAGAGGAGEACVADRGRWLVGSSAKVGGKRGACEWLSGPARSRPGWSGTRACGLGGVLLAEWGLGPRGEGKESWAWVGFRDGVWVGFSHGLGCFGFGLALGFGLLFYFYFLSLFYF